MGNAPFDQDNIEIPVMRWVCVLAMVVDKQIYVGDRIAKGSIQTQMSTFKPGKSKQLHISHQVIST